MYSELKQVRISKGYTLEQVAKKGGISRQYLSEIENGYKVNPSLNTLEKIAIGLNEELPVIYYIIKSMQYRIKD